MLTQRMTHATVCVTAALLLGSILSARSAHAQALVKVTPLGSLTVAVATHEGDTVYDPLTVSGVVLAVLPTDQLPVTAPAPSN